MCNKARLHYGIAGRIQQQRKQGRCLESLWQPHNDFDLDVFDVIALYARLTAPLSFVTAIAFVNFGLVSCEPPKSHVQRASDTRVIESNRPNIHRSRLQRCQWREKV